MNANEHELTYAGAIGVYSSLFVVHILATEYTEKNGNYGDAIHNSNEGRTHPHTRRGIKFGVPLIVLHPGLQAWLDMAGCSATVPVAVGRASRPPFAGGTPAILPARCWRYKEGGIQ